MARGLFVEPFYGGSHHAFADGLRANSHHEIELLTRPEGEPRHTGMSGWRTTSGSRSESR